MHPRNRYSRKHDFADLVRREPELEPFLITTPDGKTSLDFSARTALLLLNRTLLRRDYQLPFWDLPAGHLVPPIPGRLDYIHSLGDLIGREAQVLDVGTGASLIYPILGVCEYGWHFVGTDIDPRSLKVATAIATMNDRLRGRVEVRRQPDPEAIFHDVIRPRETFTATMCNPPFFTSREAAEAAGNKKWKKLGRNDRGLSFGGSDRELWTPGGELRFLRQMIRESGQYARQVEWFTTLVSKRGYLPAALAALDRAGVREHKVVTMEQGNKKSRMLAWRY